MSRKVILIFLDGVGLGERNSHNPFCQGAMPFLTKLLNQPLLKDGTLQEKELFLKGIDACLGVKGIPQSATGQTALFTGQNASQFLGYHLPAFPNKALKGIIEQYSILKQLQEKGLRGTFANTYTQQYFEMVETGKRIHSVTTLCVLAAGIPFRFEEHLLQNNGVYWDMTRHYLQGQTSYDIPLISPEIAGQHLGTLAQNYELVLYECFLPDLIGHKKSMPKAIDFLMQLDLFIKGLLASKGSDVSVVITSDHGNIEDLSTGEHTLNLVPLLVFGELAQYSFSIESLTDITHSLLTYLTEEQ